MACVKRTVLLAWIFWLNILACAFFVAAAVYSERSLSLSGTAWSSDEVCVLCTEAPLCTRNFTACVDFPECMRGSPEREDTLAEIEARFRSKTIIRRVDQEKPWFLWGLSLTLVVANVFVVILGELPTSVLRTTQRPEQEERCLDANATGGCWPLAFLVVVKVSLSAVSYVTTQAALKIELGTLPNCRELFAGEGNKKEVACLDTLHRCGMSLSVMGTPDSVDNALVAAICAHLGAGLLLLMLFVKIFVWGRRGGSMRQQHEDGSGRRRIFGRRTESQNIWRRNERRIYALQPSTSHAPVATTSSEIGCEHDCSICLERMGPNDTRALACAHVFHKGCLDRWFQTSGGTSCPLCRKS